MEVTIDCPCGETYSFEIEPVAGRMPTTVECPECGADGTHRANRILAGSESAGPAKPSVRPRSEEAPSPDEVAEAPGASVPDAPAGFRQEVLPPSLFLGSIGSVAAGALGMLTWYFLIKTTGYELGIAAWGVGLLIGFASAFMAKGGSHALGVIAGACALVAILGGQFLVVKTYTDEFVNEFLPGAYDEEMRFAHAALAAEGDEELRQVLMPPFDEYGNEYEVPDISGEELAEFRREVLPELRAFVDGTPTRQEFEDSIRAAYQTPEANLAMLKDTFSLFTLLWLFLGVGSAYRLARGSDAA